MSALVADSSSCLTIWSATANKRREFPQGAEFLLFDLVVLVDESPQVLR